MQIRACSQLRSQDLGTDCHGLAQKVAEARLPNAKAHVNLEQMSFYAVQRCDCVYRLDMAANFRRSAAPLITTIQKLFSDDRE